MSTGNKGKAGPRAILANGCVAHPDCFTCPFDDCIAVSDLHSEVAQVNQAELKRYKRKHDPIEKLYRFEARCLLAARMARAGATNRAIAQALEISPTTAATYINHGIDIQQRPLKGHQGTQTTIKPSAARLPISVLYQESIS